MGHACVAAFHPVAVVGGPGLDARLAPARYNPWAPLNLIAKPDVFLRYKLRRLGRCINITRDWNKAADGMFLHALQERGCRYFGILLGPDYNAAHRTHFHAGSRGFGYCQ